MTNPTAPDADIIHVNPGTSPEDLIGGTFHATWRGRRNEPHTSTITIVEARHSATSPWLAVMAIDNGSVTAIALEWGEATLTPVD